MLLLSKLLTLKAGQLRSDRRPRRFLTQTVEHPYSVCFLTRHKFKGVQWGSTNNIKKREKSVIFSALSTQIFAQGPELVPSTGYSKKSPNTNDKLCATELAYKGNLGNNSIQPGKKITSQSFALASSHGINNISAQYHHQPK